MTTKEKVLQAQAQAAIDLKDRIIELKRITQSLEHIHHAVSQGRLDGLDYRIQDIIDDPSIVKIRDFADDPEIIASMKLGLI